MVRVPLSRIPHVRSFLVNNNALSLPLFSHKIPAGFPSPADDYIENAISLDEHLVQHPAATFCLRVMGDSMIEVGIFPNDLLIVDRSIEPQSGHIVVAAVNGENTVKRLLKKRGKIYLVPENKKFQPIEIKDENDFQIWGVVIHSVRHLT